MSCASENLWQQVEHIFPAHFPSGLRPKARQLGFDQSSDDDFAYSTLAHMQLDDKLTFACSSQYRGEHSHAGSKGFTVPDFETGKVTIFIQDGLAGEELIETLLHESIHAIAFSLWMKHNHEAEVNKLNYAMQELEKLGSLLELNRFNGYYQSLSKIKREKLFKLNSAGYIHAYANTYACIEYQAFALSNLGERSEQSIAQIINQYYVPKYLSKRYKPREINLIIQQCKESGLVSPVQVYLDQKQYLFGNELKNFK